ncbi:putative X-ray repair cross-complementing protein 6 [Apostichopus japonicus]|uniref:Putative X-ray repair cross-complementing protein 6 n=1 Tax=Stichopus japonicus TaxID=307972 RepID=A0A2G8L852_STIJA|nr:putative X-ray repair cross-complementing protein 6 [Apostichopus japonicus]
MDMVFPDGYVPGAKPPPKRKADKAAGGASKRAAKDNSPVDVEDLAKQGKLVKLTVAVLKEFCQSKGLATGGKKNDLINEIKSFFGL